MTRCKGTYLVVPRPEDDRRMISQSLKLIDNLPFDILDKCLMFRVQATGESKLPRQSIIRLKTYIVHDQKPLLIASVVEDIRFVYAPTPYSHHILIALHHQIDPCFVSFVCDGIWHIVRRHPAGPGEEHADIVDFEDERRAFLIDEILLDKLHPADTESLASTVERFAGLQAGFQPNTVCVAHLKHCHFHSVQAGLSELMGPPQLHFSGCERPPDFGCP